MKAYKGFDRNMKCRGFQFKEGETYEEQEANLCRNGFHACEMPLDVLSYYDPPHSVYHEVELEDVSPERHTGDSKVCAKKIKIGAKLSIRNLVEAQIEYVKERAHEVKGSHTYEDYGAASATGNQGTASAMGSHGVANATGYQGVASATGYHGAASATGDRGVASATGYYGAASATGDRGIASATCYRGTASATGDQGATSATGSHGVANATGIYGVANATGVYGVASATGDCGAASATGDYGAASATGKDSVAIACGYRGRAKAALGNVIFLVERGSVDDTTHLTHPILAYNAAIVDGVKIKPDTWYTLTNGEFTEVDEDE